MTLLRSPSVTLRALCLIGACSVAAVAHAQPQPGQRPHPPEEAFAACAGRAAGDACAVDFRGRHVTGTCAQHPEGRLGCRPEGMPPPPR